MLALERRNIILERLNLEGKVIVSALSQEFDVTEETIRRDIEKLEREGLATKTYGGALSVSKQTNKELPYLARKKRNIDLKQDIAEKVAEMINDGDQLMLDASTTSLEIAKKIKQKNNITIITNSLEILVELADKTGWTILSTGGTLKEGSYSLSGSSAEKMIRDHHVDIEICSAKGIDMNMGITESNEKDAEIKKSIFNAANLKILALDHTKFEKISFIKVCDIKDVDVIATDCYPGDAWKRRIEDAGCRLEVYGDDYENSSN